MSLPGAGPAATRGGDLLFIAAQNAVQDQSGRVPSGAQDVPAEVRRRLEAEGPVHALEWPVAAQTWAVYDKLARILGAHGAGLSSLVRTNTYFRDLRDFPAMERTRAALLEGVPPASTVVQVSERGWDAQQALLVEAVAVLPPADKQQVQGRLRSPAHFSVGIRAGGLVWPAGQTGYDPQSGAHLRGIDDLPEGERWMKSPSLHLNVREGPILAQAWQAYQNLRTILEDGGSSLQQVVREVAYLRNLRLLPGLERVRRRVFGRELELLPSTIVQVADLSRERSALIEIDMVGATEEPNRTLEPSLGGARTAMAGGLVFISGARGLRDDGAPAAALEDLDHDGRMLLSGLVAPMSGAGLQAYASLRSLVNWLEQRGIALQSLARLSFYVDDFAAQADVQRVSAALLGEHVPSTTLLAVPRVDADPRLHLKLDAVVLS